VADRGCDPLVRRRKRAGTGESHSLQAVSPWPVETRMASCGRWIRQRDEVRRFRY